MNNKTDLVVTPAAGMGASIGSQGDRRPEVHQGSRPGVPADYSAQVGLLKIIGNAATYKLNFYAFIWHALFFAFVSKFIDVNTVLSSLYGLGRNQIGNFLLLQFLGMTFSSLIWNWVAKRFKYKGIFFGFIIIGSFLPIMTLLLSRHEIAVYQWVFFIAGFSISAYAISVQGILLEITNNDNRAIYAGIKGRFNL